MKNILVAVDFDTKTNRLLKQAAEIAGKFNSKIWIIHVAAPDPDFVGYKGTGTEYVQEQRIADLRKEHRVIQRYAAQLTKQGFNATALMVQGTTVQTVLDESKKLKIDLLIIGSHKHGLLYRAFAEMTTSAVIKKSKIPILVVPLD